MLRPIDLFAPAFGPSRFFLAPMAGITDTVFRSLMREMGAEVVISELLSAEGLRRGGARTRDMMAFCESERPVGIQIFGADCLSMVEAAQIVEASGADFVDLNFGCPVKKVVCDGGGAAWLKDPIALGKLLSAIKSKIKIPLTIKVRTGWDELNRNVAEVVHVAADSGVAWVAIHGRTRAQGYAGLADWELIKTVAHQSKIPIIGNGDLITAEQALEKLKGGYAHAVMIGRGALKNPWIFKEALGHEFETKDFTSLIHHHFELAIAKKDRHRAFISLKKFFGWYAAGFPYSSTFRSQLFETNDVDELKKMALDYFSSVKMSDKKNENQPFLMGGHG
jgi:tRNA-dihydrouridine synthase B